MTEEREAPLLAVIWIINEPRQHPEYCVFIFTFENNADPILV